MQRYSGEIARELVRDKFERDDPFDIYNLGTTFVIETIWPITTPTSSQPIYLNFSSRSTSTRENTTKADGDSVYGWVFHVRFRLEQNW